MKLNIFIFAAVAACCTSNRNNTDQRFSNLNVDVCERAMTLAKVYIYNVMCDNILSKKGIRELPRNISEARNFGLYPPNILNAPEDYPVNRKMFSEYASFFSAKIINNNIISITMFPDNGLLGLVNNKAPINMGRHNSDSDIVIVVNVDMICNEVVSHSIMECVRPATLNGRKRREIEGERTGDQ